MADIDLTAGPGARTFRYIVVADDGRTAAMTVAGIQGLSSWAAGFRRVAAELFPELTTPVAVAAIDNADGSRTIHIGDAEGELASLPVRFAVFHQFDI